MKASRPQLDPPRSPAKGVALHPVHARGTLAAVLTLEPVQHGAAEHRAELEHCTVAERLGGPSSP